MCRRDGRRCRHATDHDRDRDRLRRQDMKRYRAGLIRAAQRVSGPRTLALLTTAPASALGPMAAALGLDPAAVSDVVPAKSPTHDISRTLHALRAAQVADASPDSPADLEHPDQMALFDPRKLAS